MICHVVLCFIRSSLAGARTELAAVQEQYVKLCGERREEKGENGAVAREVVETAIEEVTMGG